MRLRALLSVYLVAVAAILWLLLPRWWSGLSLLPLMAIWAVWARPRARGRHELERELEDQAHELELEDVPAFRPSPELARWAARPPSRAADPVGHYAARAWQQAGPVFQSDLEREGEPLPEWAAPAADRVTAYGYEAGSHGSDYQAPPGPAALLSLPGPVAPSTGGPAAADSDTGEAGPPALNHERELEDQAAELDPDQWPDPYDLAAEAAIARTRELFDKIRDHFKEGPA